MRLTRLAVEDWRNVAAADLDTDAPFLVLHGPNAQGKTNLLEAVYQVATLKSFRTRRLQELVKFGAQRARVVADVAAAGSRRQHVLDVTAGGRKVTVDGKAPESLVSYFDHVRAVLFAPDDVEVVGGEPAVRRRFLDRAAFTLQPAFLEVARDYRRVLEHKGALLRAPARGAAVLAQLDVLDEQLAVLGARVVDRRRRLVDELSPLFGQHHAAIVGGATEQAEVRYRSRLGGEDLAALAESHRGLLRGQRVEELRRGRVLDGPHRDDLDVLIAGRPARLYASQGQVRSLVLALKLAELQAAWRLGLRPLFLLDDLSSELDRRRIGHLVRLLRTLEVQVIVTTTEPELLGEASDVRRVAVEGGVATVACALRAVDASTG